MNIGGERDFLDGSFRQCSILQPTGTTTVDKASLSLSVIAAPTILGSPGSAEHIRFFLSFNHYQVVHQKIELPCQEYCEHPVEKLLPRCIILNIWGGLLKLTLLHKIE